MVFTFENLPSGNESLSVPVYILKGKVSNKRDGVIGAFSDTYPSQFYKVTNGYFKLYLHLAKGLNKVQLQHLNGGFRTNGYVEYDPNQTPVDEIQIVLNYDPLDDKLFNQPKIHLCVLVGRDSQMVFDCPNDKLFEGNGIQTAIRKLRVGGRLMQAFTMDEMSKNGLGKRCFRFIEEECIGTTSYQDEMKQTIRSEIKIHIIPSKYSVSEIRDANYAQQNPKASDAGKLFSMAMEGLSNYGGPFANSATSSTPALAAVMILDAHWDPRQNLILGHAALGGGNDQIKLAIFGSQGLHSWPMNWESVFKSFTDCTKLNTKEVANDCNECSQYWECLCVSLGAFMHEIGHSLGCPHQEHGVMLRDYVTMNRKFLTEEMACVRTRKGQWGPVMTKDEPGWHRLDMLRFLYHPAFALATDFSDQIFKPSYSLINQGMKLPDGVNGGPTFSALDENNLLISSDTGVYLVEIHIGEWSRLHYEYCPQILGGIGIQKSIKLDYNIIQSQLAPQWRNKPIKLEVLALGFGQRSIDNLKDYLISGSKPQSIGNGMNAFKSDVFGLRSGNQSMAVVNKQLKKIRVTHGYALDGVRFIFLDGTYTDFGNFKSHYSDFDLSSDEKVIGVVIRSGAWVDGIQFITNKKTSPAFGGQGGGANKFMVPKGQFLGLYGEIGNWVNKIGVLYG